MALSFKKLFGNTNKVLTPERVVGIDLGASSVKVVEIQKQDDVLTLATYGELQLGPYGEQALGSAVQLSLKQKTEAVVDVLRESKVQAKSAIFTMPLPSSFITTFSITANGDEDIDPRVRVEARKYIPVPISDVILEWTELPPLGQVPKTVHDIFLVAVQNEAQQEQLQLKQSVGMTADPSEIEIFSTLRALSKSADGSLAIIDLGAQTSKLYIANKGLIRKTHRVFAGGAQVTAALANSLSIPYEQAENIKRGYQEGLEHAAEVKKIFTNSFDRPLQEFKRVMQQYEVRAGAPIDRVVVTGGSAAFADIEAYASYLLDRTIERANAFNKIAYPAFMEDMLTEIAPSFSVALGAALRTYE